MKHQPSKTVLITGASSGFGLEFAKIFARERYTLILISRSLPILKKIAKQIEQEYPVKVYVYSADLFQPDASEKVYQWVKSKGLKVDCLINNAGIGYYGRFIENSLEKEKELLQLNIVLLTELCHRFIKDMVQRGGGKVLNIASIAAFQAGAYYATYFASKAYVLLLTEALDLEYRKNGISISALCPGPAKTRFFEKAKMATTSPLLQANFHEAQYVAEEGFKGLMNGKRIIIPGIKNKMIAQSYRILPRKFIADITKSLISIAARG